MSNTKEKKTEYRCFNCNKKLAVGVAVLLEIKCTRCGHVNEYSRERAVVPVECGMGWATGKPLQNPKSCTGARKVTAM